MNNEHCVKICNSLLRGERSAIEAYREGVTSPPSTEIKQILQEHVDSAIALEQNILAMGGVPDLETGTWPTSGHTPAGQAFLLGEQTSLRDYQAALDDQFVLDECKTLIRSHLLPRIEQHLEALEQLHQTA
ncbi:hypothetical protein BH09VER1_BH09VER1_11580 [soil metagenome]